MKSPLIFVIIFILISAASCRKIGREVIELKNNYTDTIFTVVAWAGMNHLYPDTLLPLNRPGMRYVPPGKKRVINETGMGGNWASIFSNLPSDTLSIYLFDSKTLSGNDWQEIRDGYLILKRFDLSLHDLKDNNFTLTYP
jgi:hypothetical protein